MKKNIEDLIKDIENKIKKREFDDAIQCLKEIINDEKYKLLGLSTIADIFVLKEDFSKAISFFNQIIEINPTLPFIYNNKGFALLKIDALDQAKECFKLAIEHKRNFFEAHNNFGIILQKQNDFIGARKYYLKSIEINKHYVDAYDNLIKLEIELNNLDTAEELCKKINKIKKNELKILNNLGIIYKRKNNLLESIKCFEKTLQINKKFLPGIINLAKNYFLNNDYKNSKNYYEQALIIDKNNINALSGIIYLKLKICDWDGLEQMKNRLFSLAKNENKKVQPYISLLLTDDIFFQKKIAVNWSSKYLGSTKKTHQFVNEKIRIGYFSTDFHKHAIISLTEKLFENHNKDKFEIYGFNLSNTYSKTEFKNNLLKNFNDFFDCKYKSKSEIYKICENLNLDFVIDMNMHTHGARPELFQDKLAPIQINFLGYPGTSGNNNYDYIVADQNLISSKQYQYYTEKIIFMPDTYQPNSFKNNTVWKTKRDKFNLPKNKFLFCCYNNNIKINEFIIKLWVEILKKSENSAICILEENASQVLNLKNTFKKYDIDESKIIFSKKVKYQDHLERLTLSDLFLDTFPYGGHTTAIEALNSNLPILTMEGNTFQSKVSSSLLRNLDLNELVTKNEDDYIKKALEIYNNREHLLELKKKLVINKEKSKIFNNKIYTKNFETALEKIYYNLRNEKNNENIFIN